MPYIFSKFNATWRALCGFKWYELLKTLEKSKKNVLEKLGAKTLK